MEVITGGTAQIERLKDTLRAWLKDLFSGQYDEAYVVRRWKVGQRHVEIGLDQVYTGAALSRLRGGLLLALEKEARAKTPPGIWPRSSAARGALNKLLDLDLAIIEDAYQAEFLAHQSRTERALQNERLAAIGETMTGLVHESRNALQRARACLEMLAVEIADRPGALNLVERIQHAQNDLHQLFEEVREYAAPIQLQLQKCNLADIWRQAWQDLSGLLEEKKLRLVESTHGLGLECSVDPFTLRHAFRNILENAIQASPPGSRVEIALRTATVNGQEGLQITISDQGPGISAEIRTRSLGAVLYHQNQRHRLRPGNHPAHYPIARRPNRSGGCTSARSTDTDLPGARTLMTKPLRIAVADDEQDMRDFFERMLPLCGHQVVAVAETGRELVEHCRSLRPDLVITDIKMPDMDGIDAATAICQERPCP